MKSQKLILRSLGGLLFAALLPLAASGQNLINNGDFEIWTDTTHAPYWSGSNILQGPGLDGSNYSAILPSGGTNGYAVTGTSSDAMSFQLHFVFAVNQYGGTWEQPLILALFQADPVPSTPWITLRVAGTTSPKIQYCMGVDGEGKTIWSSNIAGDFITRSTYDSGTNTYTTLNQYELVLSYDANSNSYSIAYGVLDGTLTSTDNITDFQTATSESYAGLTGLRFFAYNNGVSIDNVSVTAIPEAGAVLPGVGALLALVLFRLRRRRAQA
jgi:hypothetical protein